MILALFYLVYESLTMAPGSLQTVMQKNSTLSAGFISRNETFKSPVSNSNKTFRLSFLHRGTFTQFFNEGLNWYIFIDFLVPEKQIFNKNLFYSQAIRKKKESSQNAAGENVMKYQEKQLSIMFLILFEMFLSC